MNLNLKGFVSAEKGKILGSCNRSCGDRPSVFDKGQESSVLSKGATLTCNNLDRGFVLSQDPSVSLVATLPITVC
jgi:hypothetical protein